MTPTEFAIKLGMEGDTMNSEHDHSNFLRENVLEAATQPALIDDPETDGTDFAHPAWWRGQDHALEMICHHVNLILDGKDDGKGENLEGPWRELRRRLLALVKTQPAQDVAALVDRAKQATAILRLPERLNLAKYEVTPTQAGDWACLIELLATALLAEHAARVRAEVACGQAIGAVNGYKPAIDEEWSLVGEAVAALKAERDALAAKLAEAERERDDACVQVQRMKASTQWDTVRTISEQLIVAESNVRTLTAERDAAIARAEAAEAELAKLGPVEWQVNTDAIGWRQSTDVEVQHIRSFAVDRVRAIRVVNQ